MRLQQSNCNRGIHTPLKITSTKKPVLKKSSYIFSKKTQFLETETSRKSVYFSKRSIQNPSIFRTPTFINASLVAGSSSLRVVGLPTDVRNRLGPSVCLNHTVFSKSYQSLGSIYVLRPSETLYGLLPGFVPTLSQLYEL